MQKRYLYTILFGIPGLFVAGTFSVLLFGGLAGILWLYVFGDSPWPAYAETILSLLFILSVLTIWGVTVVVGYMVGKRFESDPGSNRNHVMISAGLTVLFILFMVLYQWRVGSLGPQSDSLQCSEFCVQHGFSGSSLPPGTSETRICSCYDEAGNEAFRIPLDHILPR